MAHANPLLVCRMCHHEIVDPTTAVSRGVDAFCPACWESCGPAYDRSGAPSTSGFITSCPDCGAEAVRCDAPRLMLKIFGGLALWGGFSLGMFAVAGILGAPLSAAGGVAMAILLRPQIEDHYQCRLCRRVFPSR